MLSLAFTRLLFLGLRKGQKNSRANPATFKTNLRGFRLRLITNNVDFYFCNHVRVERNS
jgi:hypothetical protein